MSTPNIDAGRAARPRVRGLAGPWARGPLCKVSAFSAAGGGQQRAAADSPARAGLLKMVVAAGARRRRAAARALRLDPAPEGQVGRQERALHQERHEHVVIVASASVRLAGLPLR